MSASLQKSLSRIEKELSSRTENAERRKAGLLWTQGCTSKGAAEDPPFRIAAACHSSKSGAFGSQFKRGWCRQAGLRGPYPPVIWLHRCFECQRRLFLLRRGGSSEGLQGKLETHILSTLSGAQPGFSGQTHTHAHTDKSGKPRAV